jgi:hypothetical protein
MHSTAWRNCFWIRSSGDGFDRFVIHREVIAFPQNSQPMSLMDGAPPQVGERQLQELGCSLCRNFTSQAAKMRIRITIIWLHIMVSKMPEKSL